MTKPVENPTQADIEAIQSDAMTYLREGAELMKGLGVVATANVPEIQQQELAKLQDQDKKTKEEEHRAELLTAFTSALPQANADTPAGVKLKEYYRANDLDAQSGQYYAPPTDWGFRADSLEKARLIEATAIWLPAQKGMLVVDEEHVEAKDKLDNHFGNGHLEPSPYVPFFVVGEDYWQSPKDGGLDMVNLLLAPAISGEETTEPGFSTVSVRLEDYEMLEEMSMERLGKPVDEADLDRYITEERGIYRVGFEDSIRRLDPSKTPYKAPRWSRASNPERREKRLKKHRENMVSFGLAAGRERSGAYKTIMPTSEGINDWDMTIKCYKLAALFGSEDVYQQTIGQLDAEYRAGLAI